MNQRIVGFDWARAIAAFSIVAFHILPYEPYVSDLLLKWAIPFFFAVSGYLSADAIRDSKWAWLSQRMLRFGIPYLFWTTLRLIDLSPLTPFSVIKQYVLCAPTNTLWFLWTLMLCIVITWFGVRFLGNRPTLILSILLAISYIGICQWWGSFGALGLWLHQNPGYALQMPMLWLWVFVLGLNAKSLPREHSSKIALACLCAGVALTLTVGVNNELAYGYSWGLSGIAHSLIGLGVLVTVRYLDLTRHHWIEQLSVASLGVYLVHPALIRVMRMGFEQSPSLGWLASQYAIQTIIIGLLSTVITFVLLRIPLLKRVVG